MAIVISYRVTITNSSLFVLSYEFMLTRTDVDAYKIKK